MHDLRGPALGPRKPRCERALGAAAESPRRRRTPRIPSELLFSCRDRFPEARRHLPGQPRHREGPRTGPAEGRSARVPGPPSRRRLKRPPCMARGRGPRSSEGRSADRGIRSAPARFAAPRRLGVVHSRLHEGPHDVPRLRHRVRDEGPHALPGLRPQLRRLIDAAALRLDPTQQLAAALGARLSQTTDDRLLSADAAAGCARLRPRQRRRGSPRPRSRTRAGCCRRRC